MALVLADRVQQTGTANTTVSFTLSGSVTGYQSFAVVGNGNTTYYAATDGSGNWEVGIGTYSTTGPTLTRTTILSSSNSGSAVTLFGTVNVFVTYPSEKSVNLDGSGNVSALGTVSSGVWQGTAVAVGYGGTGAATLTANSVLLGNGTSAVQVVAPGTSGNVLTSNGTTWTSAATAGSVSSVNGKTGTVQSVVIAGTAVASTSGTSIDFTALPSWVKRITVMFNGVSTNSTSNYLIQLGTGSTTFTTSGYVSSCRSATSTAGFLIVDGPTAASLVSGAITLTNFSGNTWVSSGVLQISGGGAYYSSGVIALAAQLTAVRITSVTPDTFDAGSVNILYEG